MGNFCCLRQTNYVTEDQTSKFSLDKNYNIAHELEKHKPKIIKIQAVIRGYLTRRKVMRNINEQYKQKVNEQLAAYSSAILNFNTRNHSGFYFGFDDEDEDYNQYKEFRGPVTLENGAVYFGEW